MKIQSVLYLFLLLSAIPSAALSQRINSTINSGWLFHKGDVEINYQDLSFDDWTTINLPHTWNNEDAFDEEDGFYRGPGWYAKVLTIPEDWESKQVFLDFEGANQVTEVYLNGEKVGKHIGGYTAFRFNLSSHLQFGQSNLLTVRVTNEHNEDIPPLRMDYTFYGGIYRNVSLIVTEPVHFDMSNNASDGVFTKLGDISHEQAKVSVYGKLVNAQNQNNSIRIETSIADQQYNVVVSENSEINLPAGAETEFATENMVIQNPSLWSPDNPNLYNVIIRIYSMGKNDKMLDEIVLPLGLRWFEFDEQNRFILNGKPLKLVGANRHQDMPEKGSALLDEDHRNDFKHIKDLGMNFVRLAHYPQARAVYNMCDRLGLLVWSEMPGTVRITQTDAFTENCLNMQREHIRQTRNHPSIVFYGYMNEVMIQLFSGSNRDMSEAERSQIAGATVELAEKLQTLSKKEAPDRKTVMAVHYTSSLKDGYNKYGLTEVPDVLGWNLYFGWYYGDKEDLTPYLKEQHERYPDRPLIMSEYGPGADVRNHSETPKPWDFTEDYQVVMHESYLEQMMNMPWLAGFAAWNAFDFGSERRGEAIPHVNQKGLMNFDRTEKAVASLYRAWFSDEPVLHIALRNYTQQGGIEDSPGVGVSRNAVKIFSNSDTVELNVNGVSLGAKSVTSTRTVVFDVPFKDGYNLLEAKDNNGVKDEIGVVFDLYTQPLAAVQSKAIAVNVGAHWSFYNPSTKELWMADRKYTPGLWGYEGGEPLIQSGGRQDKTGLSNDIFGTGNDPLFQTFVENIESYRFDVSQGLYEVKVCFTEPNRRTKEEELIYNLGADAETEIKEGSRVFSVEINGIRVLNHLNLAKQHGPLQAAVYRFRIFAKDQEGIRVKFIPEEGAPVLSGIRIKPL
ncbi:glycoside hydrolase family 2 TIM barrel-domain containing protein [Marinilabilia salmonicolor]|nr:glycoside hydrolase family 2 TIM barrel-domain containing protein [Marinilabilia salmonicolor]